MSRSGICIRSPSTENSVRTVITGHSGVPIVLPGDALGTKRSGSDLGSHIQTTPLVQSLGITLKELTAQGFTPGGNNATAFSARITATAYETNSRCSCAGGHSPSPFSLGP